MSTVYEIFSSKSSPSLSLYIRTYNTSYDLMRLRNQEKIRQQIQEWVSAIQDPEELQHILSLMKLKHSKTLRETDMKLVLHLDQKIVPVFYITKNAKETKKFKCTCSTLTAPSNEIRGKQITYVDRGPTFVVTIK